MNKDYSKIILEQKEKTNNYINSLKNISAENKLNFFKTIDYNYQKSFFLELINNDDDETFKQMFNIVKEGPEYLYNNIKTCANLMFYLCCKNNKTDIFLFILENLKEYDYLDKECLTQAIENKNIEIINCIIPYLKSSNFDKNYIPLNYAVKSNDLEILKNVLEISNPKIDNNFCLTYCSSIKQLEILAPLCSNDLFIPLRYYARKNMDDFFEYLLPFSDLEFMKTKFNDLLPLEEDVSKKSLEKINDYLLKNKINSELNDDIKQLRNKNKRKI